MATGLSSTIPTWRDGSPSSECRLTVVPSPTGGTPVPRGEHPGTAQAGPPCGEVASVAPVALPQGARGRRCRARRERAAASRHPGAPAGNGRTSGRPQSDHEAQRHRRGQPCPAEDREQRDGDPPCRGHPLPALCGNRNAARSAPVAIGVCARGPHGADAENDPCPLEEVALGAAPLALGHCPCGHPPRPGRRWRQPAEGLAPEACGRSGERTTFVVDKQRVSGGADHPPDGRPVRQVHEPRMGVGGHSSASSWSGDPPAPPRGAPRRARRDERAETPALAVLSAAELRHARGVGNVGGPRWVPDDVGAFPSRSGGERQTW